MSFDGRFPPGQDEPGLLMLDSSMMSAYDAATMQTTDVGPIPPSVSRRLMTTDLSGASRVRFSIPSMYSLAMLHACGRCSRHVADTDTECPFCGARCEPQAARPLRAGRFARAALFAGAALAGCDKGGDKKDDKTGALEPVPVPRVHGLVTEDDGGPLVGATVTLEGSKYYTSMTDHRGRYTFDQIEPGTYKMQILFNGVGKQGPATGVTQSTITVAAAADHRHDAKVALAYNPVPMPYGAPPARRRTA
jgi:hypothetical protein